MITNCSKCRVVDLGDEIYQIAYKWLDSIDVYCFLVIGEEKALLIDTGYAVMQTYKCAQSMTELPVITVNTHGHFDHVGGNGEAGKAYLAEADWKIAKEHSNRKNLSRMMKEFEERNPQLKERLKYPQYQDEMEASLCIKPCCYVSLPSCGYFDLGSRKVTFLITPGHTRGCICLMDEQTGSFFTGDMSCEEGVLLNFDESSSLKIYLESVKKMKEYYLNCGGKRILPSHHLIPAKEDIFDRLISVCERTISGELIGEREIDGDGISYRVSDEEVTIFYKKLSE